MGPTFARMARRALDAAGNRSRVIAVSRFTNDELARELADHGVEITRGRPVRCRLRAQSARR